MATNFKAEIAEALFDSSVKVSKEALLWAMSNLPDDKNHGSHSVKQLGYDRNFDHEQENIWLALGLTEDDVRHFGGIMTDIFKKINEPDSRVSTIVEGVLNAMEEHPNLIKVVTVKIVQEALEFAQSSSEMGEMAKMLKIMKMIDKLKKRNNEED